MVSFDIDEVVNPLRPGEDIEQVAILIGLLCGQDIDLKKLSPESKLAIMSFLARVRDKGETDVQLRYEEFNELLLLFNQYRVERPFFDFFFLGKDPENVSTNSRLSVTFGELKDGVKRFRGFAMLCFGNFRFAFRKLSEEKNVAKFMRYLDPWNRDGQREREKLKDRQEPLTPLTGTQDEIPGDKTWLLGYISMGKLKNDGEALERLTQAGVDQEPLERLKRANDRLMRYLRDQDEARAKGKRNNIKYLTWDYLDVYVATSMRQLWEFEETYNFVKKVFTVELKDLPKVRWFDPTQSYYENIIDKGLLEGLMLKRAKCTIYMAQEGDTLGKDSELAATLAQGKPVVAYVRRIGGEDLSDFLAELEARPLGYFRQRLLTLLADGFFERPDNRQKVSESASILGLAIEQGAVKSEIDRLLKLFDKFEADRRFQIIGEDEADFRSKHQSDISPATKLLAAIESVAADNRADTIKNKHPLGMQVHLESGVANGVLVARTEKECARLVRGILTRELKFDIETEHFGGQVTATVLLEKESRSRFRVVTEDECLTNSFWNFYLETEEAGENRNN